MNLPSKEVAIALIESYLTIRFKDWGVKDEEIELLPEQLTTPGLKTKSCKEILEGIKDTADDIKKWVELVYILDAKELSENNNETRSTLDRFKNWFFDSSKLLRETYHTIISYINFVLENENEFKQIKQDLITREAELKKYIDDVVERKTNQVVLPAKENELKEIKRKINALNVIKDHMETHFEQQIKQHDPFFKTLGEKSFNDFINNANIGARTNNICQRLLKLKPKNNENIESTILEIQSSTSAATQNSSQSSISQVGMFSSPSVPPKNNNRTRKRHTRSYRY